MITGLSRSIFLSVAILAASIATCTVGGGGDTAGGTGTGNPPVVVSSVSVIADTSAIGPVLNKMNSQIQASREMYSGSAGAPRGPFPISDEDGLQFIVQTATIHVQRIYFIPDSLVSCDSYQETYPEIDCDSEGIFIEGPFVFNAIDGTSQPPIDSILLPGGKYSALKLMVFDSASSRGFMVSDTAADSLCPIIVAGIFTYDDTVRNFTMKLSVNELHPFIETESLVSLDQTASAFIVALNVAQWLDSVNFNACFLGSSILFNVDGNLVIDPTSGAGPCNGVAGQVRDNILNSARMYTRNRGM